MGSRSRTFSRRQVLKTGAGVAAAAAFVSYPIRSSAQGTTTVRLSTSSSGVEAGIVQQVIDAFQAANPDIKVSNEAVPSDYPTKLTTDLAAGTAADVFYCDALLAPDFMVRNLLMPLDDYIVQSGGADDFFPNLLAAFQYGGQTFGLPKDWSAAAMWYSTDNFSAAGINAPPTTWDELTSVLQTLTDSTGIPGAVIAPDPASEFMFEYQAGGSIVSPDFSRVEIGGQPTLDALNYYYGMYKNGLATSPADVGANDQATGLAQGSASVAFSGNWNYGGYAQNFPDFKFGVAPMPAGPTGIRATSAFTVSYSMFAGTQVADAAWKLLSYLTGPEGMLTTTTGVGVMPSRKSLTEPWLAQFPDRRVFIDAAEYARPWQFGPGGQLLNGDATGILQALFAGSVSVEEAASQLKAAAEKDIQLQAPGAAATPTS